MSVQLNHSIVPAHDARSSAAFLADLLGRPAPSRFGPFYGVEVDNGVTLDFMRVEGRIAGQPSPRRDQPARRWPRPLLGGPERS